MIIKATWVLLLVSTKLFLTPSSLEQLSNYRTPPFPNSSIFILLSLFSFFHSFFLFFLSLCSHLSFSALMSSSISFCFRGQTESWFHCEISHNRITIMLFSVLLMHNRIIIPLSNMLLLGNCSCTRLGSGVLVSYSLRFASRTSNMTLNLCLIIWLRRETVGINNLFVCRTWSSFLWEVDDH